MLTKITEYFVVISASYVGLALITNVGYFRVVGFEFADLFSFQDIFQVNIFVGRNIISIMIVWGVFALALPLLAMLGGRVNAIPISKKIFNFMIMGLNDSTWLGSIFFVGLVVASIGLRSLASGYGFFVELVIFASLPVLIIGWLWTLWRDGGLSEGFLFFLSDFKLFGFLTMLVSFGQSTI